MNSIINQKERILYKLGMLWNLVPEQRFGQLLTNLVLVGDEYPQISTLIKSEVWNMTDNQLEDWLNKSLMEDKNVT